MQSGGESAGFEEGMSPVTGEKGDQELKNDFLRKTIHRYNELKVPVYPG